MNEIQLPDTLSGLINTALIDLNYYLDDDPENEVEMSRWLSRNQNGQCQACLAGAVMYRNSKERGEDDIHRRSPDSYDSTTHDKLVALDFARSGNIASACHRTGQDVINLPGHLHSYHITPYHIDPMAFRKDMAKLATMLTEAGY